MGVLCLWSDQSESWFFLRFLICGLVQVLFLSLVVNFSVAIFLLLPMDYICFQVHILTSLAFLWGLCENSLI